MTCRDTPVNPFEEVRRQPEPSQSVSARRPAALQPAAPLSAQAPFGDPATLRLEEMPPLQLPAPATGNPETLRYSPGPMSSTHSCKAGMHGLRSQAWCSPTDLEQSDSTYHLSVQNGSDHGK